MDLDTAADWELVEQSQGGSLTAFEHLVHRYERRVYGFVFQSCRNEAEAVEITQETMVRAYQAIQSFDLRYPFGAWLFAIARRKCIDHYRARRPDPEPAPEPEDHEDPGELLARREESEALWRVARRRLTEVQFQALWLRYAEDLDVPDIAQVLRKSRTHVKVLLFRAREILRKELKPELLERAGAIRNPPSQNQGDPSDQMENIGARQKELTS